MLSQKAREAADSFKRMAPGEEMGEFYDNIEPAVYNEMCKLINFTEKDEVAR